MRVSLIVAAAAALTAGLLVGPLAALFGFLGAGFVCEHVRLSGVPC